LIQPVSETAYSYTITTQFVKEQNSLSNADLLMNAVDLYYDIYIADSPPVVAHGTA
jgi:hypothetical protein